MASIDRVPERALAVFAHPDDPEVACAGTLARWAAKGSETHLVICNQGDKGSFDAGADPRAITEARARETAAAAEVLGLASFEILGYPDGEIENDAELREKLVRRVRALRPEIVVCPDPTAVFFGSSYVNHHDHRAVGWAVLDACAPMAASPLYFPAAGSAHQIDEILLAGTLEPDAWVDIGEVLDVKARALLCHSSQLGDQADDVAELVRYRAAEAGRPERIAYAEAFRRLVLEAGRPGE